MYLARFSVDWALLGYILSPQYTLNPECLQDDIISRDYNEKIYSICFLHPEEEH